MTTPEPVPDVQGPVFESYRQSDGTAVTAELAHLLRAAGIPVWRDKDDLPLGDTTQRLAQAIADGISGGVLVVTPDIANSTVVRATEAPLLVGLHSNHPEFALGIINAVTDSDGKPDYSAPDRLLGVATSLKPVDQHPATRAGLLTLTAKMLSHRTTQLAQMVTSAGGVFTLHVQTRNTPQVRDRTESVLDVRVRPSAHERLPSSDGLRDLRDVIRLLPDAVTRTGATRLRVSGGAHLTVALAIGAASPSSRIGHMEVIDQRGEVWASEGDARPQTPARLSVASAGRSAGNGVGRGAVAFYLDLVPGRSDAAFERLVEENANTFVAWEHVVAASGDRLDPTAAGAIAAEAAYRVRQIANDNSNAEVHLILRCPYPMALLIGRLTNTLRIVAYEWDDTDPEDGNDFRARFVPTLRLRTSATAGVIREVLIP